MITPDTIATAIKIRRQPASRGLFPRLPARRSMRKIQASAAPKATAALRGKVRLPNLMGARKARATKAKAGVPAIVAITKKRRLTLLNGIHESAPPDSAEEGVCAPSGRAGGVSFVPQTRQVAGTWFTRVPQRGQTKGLIAIFSMRSCGDRFRRAHEGWTGSPGFHGRIMACLNISWFQKSVIRKGPAGLVPQQPQSLRHPLPLCLR